jgi:hypothetical protein
MIQRMAVQPKHNPNAAALAASAPIRRLRDAPASEAAPPNPARATFRTVSHQEQR